MAQIISGARHQRVDNNGQNDLTVAANTYQGIRDIHFKRMNQSQMQCQDCGATVDYVGAADHAMNHPAPTRRPEDYTPNTAAGATSPNPPTAPAPAPEPAPAPATATGPAAA